MTPDLPPAASAGTLDAQGNRWWTLDLSRMLPIYRDVYERVFAERLERYGVGAAGFVRRSDAVLVYGGPDEVLRTSRPAVIAEQRLAEGDQGWVAEVDDEWRGAARSLDAATTELTRRLLAGEPAGPALAATLDAKIALNALGVDSMLPSAPLAERWLAGRVAGAPLSEVLEGCYLPASGEVAFDAYELESLTLARDSPPNEAMPEKARQRFVLRGLFYRYDALDTAGRERVLVAMPRQAAAAARASARGSAALAAAIEELGHRSWRRRYHRQWAFGELRAAGPRALALFRFAGSARDYDEVKRSANMGFWRALFMLADGLRFDLRSPRATAGGLRAALDEYPGAVPVDPVFAELSGPGTASIAVPHGRR